MGPRTRRLVQDDANAYIVGVGLVGVVCLAAYTLVVPPTPASAGDASILVVLGALSVWSPLRFYRGGGVVGFNLLGAMFVAAALVLPISLAPAVVGLASLLGYSTRVRNLRKVVFNVGQDLVWSVLAATAVGAIGISANPTSPRSLAAAAAAAAIMVFFNFIFLQELFRRIEGRTSSEHRQQTSLLFVMTFVGNLIYGLVLAVALLQSLTAAVLTGILLGAVSLGYRGFAAMQVEGEKIDRLHAMSQELVEASRAHASLAPVVARVARLLGAAMAELHVDGSPVLRQAADGSAPQGGHETKLEVPVTREGVAVGTLVVRGRQGMEPWSEADRTLLRSVANDLAVVLDNHQLFADLADERAALVAETRKLTDILDAASDGITLIRTDDRVVSWNPAMYGITGIRPEDALNRPWYSLLRLRTEDGTEVAVGETNVLSMALKGVRSPAFVLWQIMRDDGQWRWVECTAAPVERTDDGGAVVVFRDVTSQTEVSQLKEDFIATVSHELRTPMTPLKGFLSTLRHHGESLDDEQRSVVLTSMESQVERLNGLIVDLLAVADLSRAEFQLVFSSMPLQDVAQDVHAMFPTIAQDRVSVDDRSGGAFVRADPDALRRILHSLVDNALKHTTGDVLVRMRTVGGDAVIEVSDQGPGIAKRDQERIFDRFARLGDHLHRTQGPGLGLTIARALAQQMEGTVTVTSSIGSGATFDLRLPLAVDVEVAEVRRDLHP